jgi:HlyD family secretion protein
MNRSRLIFVFSCIGLLVAVGSAVWSALPNKTQPPQFTPATNPYEHGIFANGIVESDLGSGENINIYPEVPGRVVRVRVREGDRVKAGAALVELDDTVQRAAAEQQKQQANAAEALLRELKAMPRPEALAVVQAQVTLADAARKTAGDQFDKLRRSHEAEPRSISQDALDNAANALHAADASLQVARRQYELTRAGAWAYDIDNQQLQYAALSQAYEASRALLDRYTLRATADGVVLAVNAAEGSYVSTQGAYDSYTQAFKPLLVMGTPQDYLAVRCYIDEILVDRLPPPGRIRAEMTVRGTSQKIPLEFVRVQPYVSPKIQLADQRQERVDLRVLPVVFRFRRPGALRIYPGQLVDVYVGEK